jgi:hypothetical protein
LLDIAALSTHKRKSMLSALKKIFRTRMSSSEQITIAERVAEQGTPLFAVRNDLALDYGSIPENSEARFFIGFVIGYCEVMARELGSDDIRTTAITAALRIFDHLFAREKAKKLLEMALAWIDASDGELIAATRSGGTFAASMLKDEDEASAYFVRVFSEKYGKYLA